jgi:predicted HicB family RNase H-like nuclease
MKLEVGSNDGRGQQPAIFLFCYQKCESQHCKTRGSLMDDPINGHMARMDFDAEDRITVGPVIKMDESIRFHGPSVGEFKTALHSVVDSYFGPFQKLNQAADGCTNGRFMLRDDQGARRHRLSQGAQRPTPEQLARKFPDAGCTGLTQK